MKTTVVVFIALFIVLAIVGFAMDGLMWLGIIGVVGAVATAIIAMITRGRTRARGA